ncbi:MAG: hypothetical protein GQ525_10625 [Draconibacterium sp.]|nr:hypothetical protein [Draconibacterium sp.]
MPIESITIEDINVESEQGILIIDAAAILIKDINIKPNDDAVLTFDNSSNIIIENLGKTEKEILIKGEGSKHIRIVNSNLNREKITYENCSNEVSFLINESGK